MLTLFYGRGSCSLAPHIVLEEAGEPYEPRVVDVANGEQRTEAYHAINPRGRVPALRLDHGEIITENTAILPYLGKRYDLWPAGELNETRALVLIGFFATSVHPANGHISRPERYALDPSALPTIQDAGRKTYFACLKEIDEMLSGRQWFFDDYSVLDPYAFVFYVWGIKHKMPMAELKNFTLFRDRMMQRAAVERAVSDERLVV